MSGRLQDKVIIITGGGTGIGLGIARSCAREGAAVTLAQRRAHIAVEQAEIMRQAGHRALGLGCDISEREQVQALIAATVAEYGRLDVMVNNAALTGQSAEVRPFLEETDAHWRKMIDVNLNGRFYLHAGSSVPDGQTRGRWLHHQYFLGGAIRRARKCHTLLRRQSGLGRLEQRRGN